MLDLQQVDARYEKLQVLKGISMTVSKGEVVSLLGANGAGKTTVLKTITGGVSISSGRVYFEGKDITGLPGHAAARMRIAHVPETRRVFKDLSVDDNLILGGMKFQKTNADIRKKTERMYELFPRLRERRKQLAGTMSGGEQQMLAIARGLMMDPKLLILDEPSQGLAPKIVDEIFQTIRGLSQEGMTILLVEQNIYQALMISHRAYVIKNGSIILEDCSEALLQREDMKEAYLH
jgi:branched-chain amino acid transport system ATP-binding protein